MISHQLSTYLIGLVGVIYLFTAADFYIQGRYGLALAYIAYAVSNVGLYLAAIGK